MIKPYISSFFEKEYPMIMLFEYGKDILIYDAKPHFAVIFSSDELDLLVDYLKEAADEELLNKYSSKINVKFIKKLLTKFSELINNKVFSKGPFKELSVVDKRIIRKKVKYYDDNILLRKFCLEVTEDCNYRCTYCKRTIAEDYRGHSKNELSEEDACRGIDYYFNKYTDFYLQLPEDKKNFLLEILPPAISWYGGEPFLNFELIKKSAAYFKSLPWDKYSININILKFSSNTNLSIMNDEILKFIVENNVHLFVSLDGPAEEHDKCRVYRDGKGSFDIAFNNLMKIKYYNEDYYKKKVSVFGVYTKQHDKNKCVEFTSKLGTSSCQHFPAEYTGVFVSGDNECITCSVEDLLKSDLQTFKEKVKNNSVLERPQMDQFVNIFPFAKLNYDCPEGRESLNISITCPMGFDNLMLTVQGNYLICHKVNDRMPIGNCKTGLDFERIITLNQEYNTVVNNENCRSCWSVNFCNICAAKRMVGDKFVNPTKKECDSIRLHAKFNFLCFIYLSLENSVFLDKIFKYRNSLKNYIGVLDKNEF